MALKQPNFRWRFFGLSIRWIVSHGAIQMKSCSFPEIRFVRVSPRNSGNCARWRKKQR